MSNEDEVWRNDNSLGESADNGHDGNHFDMEDYGQAANYRPQKDNGNSYGRTPRPRFNVNDGTRAYSSNPQRPYRPRFNNDGEGNRAQKAYSSDRPYRPRYNNDEGGNRPQRPQYGDRPYRPRFNSGNEGGYRPRYNEEGGERPQRPQYGERPQRQQYGERPYRPRFNSGNEGGYRPRYNEEGGERPQRPQYGERPRYNNGGPRQQGGYNRGPQRRQQPNRNANKYDKHKQIEYKEQWIDPNEPIRLNKFLANAGVCSRREADEFITAGVVTVNGVVVTELGTKIKRDDKVMFHDQPVNIERKVYILLNKPKDTVTTSDDPEARKTVMDLVKNACPERIYPVGRLDRNTTGVLLLTNDGDLASKLTHPKFLKKKVYHVHLDKKLTRADMDKIATGIQLEDGEIHADAISYTDEAKKDDIGIEIHSGKNRIVRRIFESLGYKVTRLDRVYFAGLTKKGLRRGDWRFLTEPEVNFLRMGSFE